MPHRSESERIAAMDAALEALCGAFGPSGHEFQGVAGRIAEMVRPLADELRFDALGNLICIRRGAPGAKRVMLSAHMDQCGLMVTEITDGGFLRVAPLGGLKPSLLFYRQVVFANGVRGIISHESAVKENEAELKHLYVDIGARDGKEAGELVSVADVCAYAPFAVRLHGGLFSAPAADDRAGCAVLIEALRELESPAYELAAVFSVQEELGLRGATVSAYGLRPDLAVALDVCPTGDTPNAQPLGIKLGSGPALKVMDAHSVSHVGLRGLMQAKASELGIPVQLEILPYGGTDAAAMQKSRAGIPAATLSIPSRYVHSAVETVSLHDAEKAVRLLAALLEDPAAGGL